MIVAHPSNSSNMMRYTVELDGSVEFRPIVGNTSQILLQAPAGTIVAGQKYHTVVTRHGSNWILLVNHRVMASQTRAQVWPDHTQTLRIGAYPERRAAFRRGAG